MRHFVLALTAAGTLLFSGSLAGAAGGKVSNQDDPDYAIQGEYSGEIESPNGDSLKVGVQVIALGEGKFQAVALPGGLPGEGWDGLSRFPIDNGELKDGVCVFETDQGRGEIKDGVLKVQAGEIKAELRKVFRKSPTEGAKPPEGAVVLFDGTSADAFEGGKVDGGLLVAGATSKQKFGDCTVHVEFQLPFMPESREQARGNSGCYLQGRYEVQMLDSFGLTGEDNECGGIYSVKAPSTNMCYPPLAWQTYDIDYTAPKFEGDKKTANAKITVRHNGEVIQKDTELPAATTGAPVAEGPEPGPLFLQDHGDPVRYRNVWVVEKK